MEEYRKGLVAWNGLNMLHTGKTTDHHRYSNLCLTVPSKEVAGKRQREELWIGRSIFSNTKKNWYTSRYFFIQDTIIVKNKGILGKI